MSDYRRSRSNGAVYFLTIATHERREFFASSRARRLLGQSLRKVRAKRPFEMRAIVLLPDHLHMLWRLPDDDVDYSTRVQLFKRYFTRSWLAAGGSEGASTPSRTRCEVRGV